MAPHTHSQAAFVFIVVVIVARRIVRNCCNAHPNSDEAAWSVLEKEAKRERCETKRN